MAARFHRQPRMRDECFQLWLDLRKRARIAGVRAAGVTVAAGADSRASTRIGGDVEDDVIGAFGIARYSANSGQVVQPKIIANSPGNVVVGTRSITTHADPAYHLLALAVERQSAPKDVHPSDFVADHRVLRRAVIRRRTCIRDFGIHRVAFLQSEKTPAGLNRGIQVCCR